MADADPDAAASNEVTRRLPGDGDGADVPVSWGFGDSQASGGPVGAHTASAGVESWSGGPSFESTLVDIRPLVEEVNRFRRDPAKYAEEMSKLREQYSDHMLRWPDGSELETVEGVAALDDCLEDLRQAAPVAPVNVSQALSRACLQHLGDLVLKDFCSHIGSDGSTPEDRLSCFGEHREQCGENIVFGAQAAKNVVYQMLIDDGAPDRGQRANLMNGDFHFAGAAQAAHPSARFAVVLLLVDQFKAKQMEHFEIMQKVYEGATGQRVPMFPGVNRATCVQRAWDKMQEELKPPHLRVPHHLHDNILKSDRPKVHRDKIVRMKKIPVGYLQLKPGVNPAIVRAFVHRLDEDHDDNIVESELARICYEQKLDVTVEEIAGVFDEISQLRPWHDRGRRSVSFLEIFNAMRSYKKWMPSIDLLVRPSSGDPYILIYAVEELEQLLLDIFNELDGRVEGLPPPPQFDDGSKALPRNTSGVVRLGPVNKFLAALLSAVDSDSGEPIIMLPSVQSLFKPPPGPDGKPSAHKMFESVVCTSQRRLWAYVVRPYREFWLTLHKAIGLHPLVPIPVHKLPSVLMEKSVVEHIDAEQKDQLKRVTHKGALADKKRAEATAAGDLPISVWDRYGAQKAEKPSRTVAAEVPRWDEVRQQSESLVNSYLLGSNGVKADETLAANDEARTSGGLGGAAAGVTFAAKKRFNQNGAKLQRASEYQQEDMFGVSRSVSAPAAGIVAAAAAGMLGPGVHSASGLGPATHTARTRGAGSFPQSAPTGVLGHFHNTLALHEKEGSHGYPQSLAVNWDGSHIDHARAPPQKDCDNHGQPHGYAYMTKKQRSAQFNTYFKNPTLGRGATHGTHDAFTSKAKVAADQIKDADTYKHWKPHVFREDDPERVCQFGRRDFDPQVKPNIPRSSVSGIDNKPMEQRRRHAERVEDVLHRAVPKGQAKHFEQCMPTCRKPLRHEDMVTRVPQHCHMDGDQKMVSLGFGQNRHSDHRDYRLYTRPLGSQHMDKTLPLV